MVAKGRLTKSISMKLKVIFFSACLCAMLAACSSGNDEKTSVDEEKTAKNVVLVETNFELYPTSNLWTFIKLDTRTGQMWQVQYDVKGDNRMEVVLNGTSFAQGENAQSGRFGLYPTQNMFTFILLDRNDGRTWQVQWSIEESNRMVLPIN